MNFVLQEAFDIKSDKKYLKLNKCSANWTERLPKSTNYKATYLTKDDIVTRFTYLLNNIYIKYQDTLYRQIIGIPMGTDCAPDLANLFLFSYEYQYVMNLINSNSPDIEKLRYIYRYIDDLIVLNDDGYFNSIYLNIYPSELELKLTSDSIHNANYLDMNISINNKQFIHKLYDKRNDFTFKVISMPNMSSNIPFRPTYGVFYSQIVRLFNANNSINIFKADVKNLMNKLIKQNFSHNLLKKQVQMFSHNFEYNILSQYWETLRVEMLH